MRYALSALLAAHGVAHLVGFLVPWRLMSPPDMPFKTTLLAGRVDVGEAGIRVVGVLWLLTAVAMVATALGLAVQARWAGSIVLPVVAVSLALCLVELPQARIGLVLNGVLVLFLLLHPTLGAGAMRWQHTGDNARAAGRIGPRSTDTFASVSDDDFARDPAVPSRNQQSDLSINNQPSAIPILNPYILNPQLRRSIVFSAL